MRRQNNAKIITGPKAAPKAAQAQDTSPMIPLQAGLLAIKNAGKRIVPDTELSLL